MINANGKVTLAVLGQRVEDHIQDNFQDHVEIKNDLKEIKNILINGTHKINENRTILSNHLDWHKERKEETRLHWVIVGTIATIAGVIGAFLKGLLWR